MPCLYLDDCCWEKIDKKYFRCGLLQDFFFWKCQNWNSRLAPFVLLEFVHNLLLVLFYGTSLQFICGVEHFLIVLNAAKVVGTVRRCVCNGLKRTAWTMIGIDWDLNFERKFDWILFVSVWWYVWKGMSMDAHTQSIRKCDDQAMKGQPSVISFENTIMIW